MLIQLTIKEYPLLYICLNDELADLCVYVLQIGILTLTSTPKTYTTTSISNCNASQSIVLTLYIARKCELFGFILGVVVAVVGVFI